VHFPLFLSIRNVSISIKFYFACITLDRDAEIHLNEFWQGSFAFCYSLYKISFGRKYFLPKNFISFDIINDVHWKLPMTSLSELEGLELEELEDSISFQSSNAHH
jgi:hypothetical protein